VLCRVGSWRSVAAVARVEGKGVEWNLVVELLVSTSIGKNLGPMASGLRPCIGTMTGTICSIFSSTCRFQMWRTWKLSEVAVAQDYFLFHILRDYSIVLWKRQVDLILRRNGLVTVMPYFIGHVAELPPQETTLHAEKALTGQNCPRNRPSVLPGAAGRAPRKPGRR
jgi:hypothetical protein